MQEQLKETTRGRAVKDAIIDLIKRTEGKLSVGQLTNEWMRMPENKNKKRASVYAMLSNKLKELEKEGRVKHVINKEYNMPAKIYKLRG